jgi:DNA-binding transcriptional LysR family regulator
MINKQKLMILNISISYTEYMNLFFLKYFYDTVRFKSVTEASRENHVTQSAISQGITQLESTLGAKLLTHKRNSIKITQEGKEVFEWSRSLFRQVDELKLRLKESQNEYSGQLTFACSHSFALSVLPELLAEFKKEAPKVVPKVLFGHTGYILQWIKNGEIEFGLVLDNDDLSSFSLDKIYKGAFRFFQSASRKKNAPITSCIFAPARFEVHLIKQQFYKRYGYELATEMEISSWEVIAKMLTLTPSVGFLPDYVCVNQEKSAVLQPAKLNLKIPYTLYAAYPSGEELSRNAKLFINILKKLLAH